LKLIYSSTFKIFNIPRIVGVDFSREDRGVAGAWGRQWALIKFI